jgi:hypothetical protein
MLRLVFRSLLQGSAVTLLVRGVYESLLGKRELALAARRVFGLFVEDPDLLLRCDRIFAAAFNLLLADVLDGTAFYASNAAAYGTSFLAMLVSPAVAGAEALVFGGASGAIVGLGALALFGVSWYPFSLSGAVSSVRGVLGGRSGSSGDGSVS